MEDDETDDTDGADADWVVSASKSDGDQISSLGVECLREAHGKDSGQDEFLRLTGSQTPENRYRLDSLSLN